MKNPALLYMFIFLFVAVVLFVRACEWNRAYLNEIEHSTQLYNEYYTYKADATDSINNLYKRIHTIDSTYTASIEAYKNKPTKTRIREILKIDSFAIVTDTGAILSMYGVDSINVLSIAYSSCEDKHKVKDSIISIQSNVIKTDSIIIEKAKKTAIKQEKAVKLYKVIAVSSVVLGLLVLVI